MYVKLEENKFYGMNRSVKLVVDTNNRVNSEIQELLVKRAEAAVNVLQTKT